MGHSLVTVSLDIVLQTYIYSHKSMFAGLGCIACSIIVNRVHEQFLYVTIGTPKTSLDSIETISPIMIH